MGIVVALDLETAFCRQIGADIHCERMRAGDSFGGERTGEGLVSCPCTKLEGGSDCSRHEHGPECYPGERQYSSQRPTCGHCAVHVDSVSAPCLARGNRPIW